MTPSPQQKAVFDHIINRRGNLIIEAVAGSGKTTTIVEACKYIHPSERILFLAFNKKIVEELKTRLPKYVDCATFHSWCFKALRTANADPVELDSNKTNNILKDIAPKQEYFAYQSFVRKMVGLAKSELGTPNFEDLMKRHDVICEEDTEVGLEYAKEVLVVSDSTENVIDFDDMLRHVYIRQLPFRDLADWIFVDEAQDLSPLQHHLLFRMLHPGGTIIAVGDSCQAIYAFRGADSDSMAKLKSQFNCTELPLSVSFRCAQLIVHEARNEYTIIEPHPNAPIGKVHQWPTWSPHDLHQDGVIVCRNSAPLIRLAFSLLSQNIRCQVLGRDIGQGLVSLIKKLKPKDIAHLELKLQSYLDTQTMKLAEDEAKLAALSDKIECIRIFMQDAASTEELLSHIDSMFSDKVSSILTLSTIHKAKGLEWPTVYFLNEWLLPSKWAKQPYQLRQEANLRYVACTRAKLELVYFSLDNNKKY
jgi:DNA helicase-2/ATP-dependent DNA helicase PcrA